MNTVRRHSFDYEKDISGCGVFGVIDTKGERIPGSVAIAGMASMHDRGNGLGGGFAAYGIYPEMADYYAFHVMGYRDERLAEVEGILKSHFNVKAAEPIPTNLKANVSMPPKVWRYFLEPRKDRPQWRELEEEDYVVKVVMYVNTTLGAAQNVEDKAFIFSSGKNMGAFKGVGFPEDIAEFYRLDEYSGHIWTGHNRFPTNTPGWWGGAHPFTLLDWSIVHNGEISSYGINKRYLEEHGYVCTLMTDTEVVAYLIDLLIRKHGLSKRMAAWVFAPPFWDEIERLSEREKKLFTGLRMVYGSACLNGPFAILVGNKNGLFGLNDRVKLRPLVVAEEGSRVYMSSEESAIREVCGTLDKIWAPKAGEPVIVEMEGK